jgi:hypothetical protein
VSETESKVPEAEETATESVEAKAESTAQATAETAPDEVEATADARVSAAPEAAVEAPAARLDAPAKSGRVIRLLADATDASFVRRKVVVFRRLEPGDVRSEGSHKLEESPYLEARVLELAVPKRIHEEMVALDKKKREALSVATGYFRSYDPAGVLLATGGTGLFGIWLDYLPSAFWMPFAAIMLFGVAVGVWTKRASQLGIAEAAKRWTESADRKSYDLLAKDISEAWTRVANTIRREDGFYTDLRVAEGSADPVRLASIDPRPYTSEPPAFDPDDFLPSVATGDDCPVRYEHVHATGEVITKSIEGSRDFAESAS